MRLDEDAETVKVDVKDRKLIGLLAENSRMPLTKMCKAVMLSRDAVDYRMKRLAQKGVLLNCVPVVNWRALGFNTFHAFMVVDESYKSKITNLVSDLKKHPNTVSVLEYSDRWDLEWTLIAKNVVEYDEVTSEIVHKYYDVILERDSLEVIKHYIALDMPYSFYNGKKKIFSAYKGAAIDRKDLEIINVLAKDSRTSTYSIGEKVKLSPDAVTLRMRKMETQGIIRNYTSIFNLSKLGYHLYTFVIQVKELTPVEEKKFESFISNHPYVIRAVKTMGIWDILLYITATTPKMFHTTVKELKDHFSSVMRIYQTWVAYKEHCYNTFPCIIYKDFKERKD